MSQKIAVVGSSNIDLIMQVPSFPKPGETVAGGVFTQTFGGKGANQAVAAARAGGDVVFITCLGTDSYAENFMERFEEDNIDTSNVFQEPGVFTGTAIITVDENGQNCISVAPGANYKLNERHIITAQPVLREARVILLQGELHPEMLRYILNWTIKEEKKVLLNLAPAQPLEKEFLKHLAILVVNESEAGTLVGRQVKGIEQAQQAAEELATFTDGGVIVSLGKNGSYLVKDDLRQIVPAFKVKAIDTTGAGDVYCGSLASALVEGMAPLEAIRFASAAAAISVTRLGAQPSIPSRDEIEQLLSTENEK